MSETVTPLSYAEDKDQMNVSETRFQAMNMQFSPGYCMQGTRNEELKETNCSKVVHLTSEVHKVSQAQVECYRSS